MASTFTTHLARICREHLLEEKWLIGPSRRVAHDLLEQVARTGAPVVNARVETMRSIALRILAETLASGTVRVASPADRRLAVAAAWHRAMSDGGYLGAARVTPRLLTLAERTLSDLRQAGLSSEALDPDRFEHPGKGREVKALLAAYEYVLQERDLLDHADTLRRAAASARRASAPDVPWLLHAEDLRLTVLERALLDAYGADRIVRVPCDRPADEKTGAEAATDLAVLAWLEHPADAPAAPGDGSARIAHAVGEINEVRRALRACLGAGVALDRVELVYTAAEPYVPLIHETALRIFEPDDALDLGVPVTFADGVPARLSRPGRLLSAWLGWIHEGFPQSTALRMLQAGLLRPPATDDGDTVSTASLVRELRRVPIGFGRDRYASRLDEHVAALSRPSERPSTADGDGEDPRDVERRRRRHETAARLRDLLAPMAGLVPAADAPADTVVDAAATLLRDHSRTVGRLDALAHQHLLEELDAMTCALSAAGGEGPLGFDAWNWLGELPDRLRVAGSRPRPGHLHVSPVHVGGYSGRPHTVIVGLDDGRFPPAGLQDPLVLDAERAEISRRVPRSTDRVREALDDFTRLLCRLRGDVTLSFSSRHLADDRESFASPVVVAAYRILSGRHDGDHSDLLDWLDDPASFAPARPDECLDVGEWWLHRGAQSAPVENLETLIDAAYPHLPRGWQATAHRASGDFTVHDGLIEKPAPELDPRHAAGPVVSATTKLHVLGRCPLAYFQREVLGVKPPDDVDVDPRRWLDPLQFGTLLHDVLYDFVGALVADDDWPPDPDRDLERIGAVVDDHIERWRREVPVANDEAYRRQRRDIERAVEIFVREQARERGRTRPLFLEASIGMRPQGRGTEIDRLDPVEVDLPGGRRLRARARIDRIDRKTDSPDDRPLFVIWDYKSGSYVKSFDPPDCFGQGRLLQHVLYMAVAQRVLEAHFPNARVDQFRYFFPGPRTHGRIVMHSSDMVPGGMLALDRLCRLIENGAFPATTDVEDCRFCDYRAACQAVDRDLKDVCRRSETKVSAGHEALAPFRELRGAT